MHLRILILHFQLEFLEGRLLERLVFDTTLKDLPPLLLLKTTLHLLPRRKVEKGLVWNVLPLLFSHFGDDKF